MTQEAIAVDNAMALAESNGRVRLGQLPPPGTVTSTVAGELPGAREDGLWGYVAAYAVMFPILWCSIGVVCMWRDQHSPEPCIR